MENIARKLYELRMNNNYSQDELANKIGVSRQAISKWERAEGLPDLYNITKIAEVFCVSLDELLLDNHKNVENVNDNRLSNIFLGILSFLMITVLGILFTYHIITSFWMVGNLFSVDNLRLDLHSHIYILPIGLLLCLYSVRLLLDFLNNERFELTRKKVIVVFGVITVGFVSFLLTGLVHGFSLIFIYLVVFTVLIIGLAGIIIRKENKLKLIPSKYIEISKMVTKTISIVIVVSLGLMLLTIGKDNLLVKKITYIDSFYVKETSGDSTYINITEKDNDEFFYEFDFNTNLPYDLEQVYIEIYVDDFLLCSGDMINEGGMYIDDPNLPPAYSYSFYYGVRTSVYTLLIPDLNINKNNIGDISYTLYFTENELDSEIKFNVKNRTLLINYNDKNIWLWEYNALKE